MTKKVSFIEPNCAAEVYGTFDSPWSATSSCIELPLRCTFLERGLRDHSGIENTQAKRPLRHSETVRIEKEYTGTIV